MRIQRGRDEVKVMVRYPEDERRSLGNIESMRIRTPGGDEVPFGRVATVEIGRGFAAIERADRQRVVTVTADVDQDVTNADEVNGILRQEVLPDLLAATPACATAMEGEQKRAGRIPGQPEARLRAGHPDDLRAAGGAVPLLQPAADRS